MTRIIHRTTTALAIAAIAGTCASVAVAQGQQTRERPAERQTEQIRTHRTGFAKATTVMGMGIVNDNGENLGEVGDLIVDRGTGQIDYVVVHKGGLLGLGEKKVAIPYPSFAFDYSQEKFRLNVPPEHIENAAKFVPEDWVELKTTDWQDQFADMWEDDPRRSDPAWNDPYGDGLAQAETATVKGTVTDVRRDRAVRGAEQIVVTVNASDGGMRRVVLGPSWYVMSQPGAPMRGDTIEVQGFRTDRDGLDQLIARRATVDGKSFDLRNERGAARWNAVDTGSGDRAEWKDGRASPLVLLSDVIGMDIRARNEEGGQVEGAVIELESGRVAMLTLDPDENFLGIGDQPRLVPWSVASIGHESVRIDADRDMLLASEKLPDDVAVFSTPARLRPVYEAYRVDVADFRARERTDWTKGSPVSQWTSEGDIARAYRAGEASQITGKVESVRQMAVPGTSIDAVALDISTANGTRRTVVLGPKWYLDRQSIKINSGDRIMIGARSATINGQRAMIAGTVETDAGQRLVLWNGNAPAWASR